MKTFSTKKVLIISSIALLSIFIIAFVVYKMIMKEPKGMDYKESGESNPSFGFGNVDANSKNRLRINFFRAN